MPYSDTFGPRDPIGGSLVRSLFLHGLIAVAAVSYGLTAGKTEKWGDPGALGGGSVAVTSVSSIPLPSNPGRVNPVANDTESQVPAAPAKQPAKPAPREDPDAIAIKGRSPQRPKPAASTQRYQASEPRPNQVYSSTGSQAVSPMYSVAGSGEVGSGSGIFGSRFGAYMQVLRDKIARNWRSNELDAAVQAGAVIGFEIARDGSLRNVRVIQSSGNFAMDQTAQRAIIQSAPFNPLPAGYEHNSVNIDLTFRLRR